KKCMRCLSCFSSELDNGEPYCAINPETGRELEMKYGSTPPLHKKKVLIAGGGIAGMQAAITCARRGHSAILCEKTAQLGGVLRCEKDVPFKRKLDEYLNAQVREVYAAGVDVRLNTAVTPEYADRVDADVIISCMGARPVKPNIPGIDADNVVGAEEAYLHPDRVGESAVILGGGLVGCELGLHLAMMGRRVNIVEMLDHISDGGNFLHILGLKPQLKKYGIEMSFNTTAQRITPEGVICSREGAEKLFAADTVIYAVGQRPLQDEASALSRCAPEFYQIGDCVAPKNITNATSLAFMAARNIGRI
ncbi:MAG: FAD-dependent oxidoreductase, partial [Oscillospiraceae bacterium]|nr:FAD-dependent oxidoreductase [Oscillospiraceae bacterium]